MDGFVLRNVEDAKSMLNLQNDDPQLMKLRQGVSSLQSRIPPRSSEIYQRYLTTTKMINIGETLFRKHFPNEQQASECLLEVLEITGELLRIVLPPIGAVHPPPHYLRSIENQYNMQIISTKGGISVPVVTVQDVKRNIPLDVFEVLYGGEPRSLSSSMNNLNARVIAGDDKHARILNIA